MMPEFGAKSKKNLSEAHPKLQKIFNKVIQHFDCSVIDGHRTKPEQDNAYHSGKSKVQWPKSKHNSIPSMAVDVVPYPVDWKDQRRFDLFAGFVAGIAASMGIKIRWGGDWNSNMFTNDQNFHDLPHFELHPDELKTTTKPKKDVLPDGPSDDEIDDKLGSVE